MDARIDPLDENTHHEVVDLLRRSEFQDAVLLFGRLAQLAYRQGQIDAFVGVIQRINGGLEDDVRRVAQSGAAP